MGWGHSTDKPFLAHLLEFLLPGEEGGPEEDPVLLNRWIDPVFSGFPQNLELFLLAKGSIVIIIKV
jgi:hypothetical protein